MLSQRKVLAAIIILATVLFVVGVSIERSDSHHGEEQATVHVKAGEGEAAEISESAGPEEGEDEKVLGIELESISFIVLAALVSLTLALGAWLRSDSLALLGLIALAMLAFAIFDVAEVGHQIEESEAGLVVIAALVAALHLVASALAFAMRRRLGEPAG